MATSKQTKQTARNQKSGKGTAPRKAAGGASFRAKGGQGSEGLFDDRTKRDIVGVLLIVFGLALMAVVCLPGDAIVTGALSLGLRLGLGVGCYVLPLLLILIGVTFLLRFERNHVPTRAALGALLFYVALLGLIGLFAPVEAEGAYQLFFDVMLTTYGGYVGNAIAWAGLTFLGRPVTAIILVGFMVVALIVIGWSLSGLIERIRGQVSESAQARREEREQSAPTEDIPSRKLKLSERFGKLPSSTNSPTANLGKGAPALADAKTAEIGSGKRRGPKRATSSISTSIASSSEDRLAPRAELADQTQQLSDAKEGKGLWESKAIKDPKGKDAKGKGKDAADKGPLGARAGEEDKPLTRKLGSKKRSDSLTMGKTSHSLVAKAAPGSDEEGYQLPDMSILSVTKAKKSKKESEESLRDTALLLQQTLFDFGIDVGIAGWVAGPTVTLYKVELPSGVRVSRITNLTDDIALALAAPGVRIFSPIPGTNYVGVEVPNQVREGVLLGDVLPAAGSGKLEVAIGKDVEGNCVVEDLARMPHVLIAGTTGSGKSVCVNSMIMSILMRATPDEVRFIMIDPTRVEFMPYSGIPHLYVPVVTEPKEASSALSWAVAEMERRLKVMSKAGAREIKQYNAKAEEGAVDSDGNTVTSMPYIVIVIDELADLMMNVGKEVEFSISRLAQLARAAGIHLIIATQRPSTNVVTGLIKANITSRIALSVASGIDSRVILDATGAENLIGHGDMLFNKPELAKPVRLQGCYTDDKELEAVVSFLKEQGEPEYHNEILNVNVMSMGTEVTGNNGSSSNDDPLLWDAAELVVSSGLGSTSNIQRRFKVGYSRAGRIMDMLEEKGVVGPANGSKPREVLIDAMDLETLKAFETNDSE